MHHLDTNVVVAYLNGDLGVAAQLKKNLPNVAVSTIVLAELLYGARASARVEQNLQRIHQLLLVVEVANFDKAGAEAYGRIRLNLKQKGRPSGEVDTLIAAVAMAHDAVLVSHNVKHFGNIDDLVLEDWLA